MKGNFNRIKYQPWFRTCRRVCGQFIVPFVIFQLIRTLLIPTVFDVLLLAVFITIAISMHFDIV